MSRPLTLIPGGGGTPGQVRPLPSHVAIRDRQPLILRAALDLRGTLCVRYNEAQCDCCASVHKARRLIEEHES